MAYDKTSGRSLSLSLGIGGKTIFINRASPYRLTRLDGVESGEYAVNLGENVHMDGSFFKHERVEARSIQIAFEVASWENTEALRSELIGFLLPKTDGRLTISRSGVTRAIDFHIAGRPRFVQKTIYDYLTVSIDLLCPDPFFTDPTDSIERFLTVTPLFCAPLSTFASAGAVSGLFERSDTVILDNRGHADIGIVAEILAEHDSIVNPSISTSGECVKVLTTVEENSALVISTLKGNKCIALDGEPLSCYDRTSVFFQLPPGRHVIRLSAESGLEFASTTIKYRLKYLGV